MSEFSQYKEDEVVGFSSRKLEIVYREALRQRASRFSLLGEVINQPHLEKQDQKELNKRISKMLSPHFVVKEIRVQEVKDSWNALRSGRRG